MKISEVSTIDVLNAYGISTDRSGGTSGISYQCPLHQEKKGHSFVVFPDGHWHCFGKCNTGGDAVRFVMLKENVPYKTAIKEIETLLKVELEYNSTRHEHANLYKTNERLCLMFQEELKKHPKIIQYLKQERGYTEESIRYWRIGYVTRELLLEDPDLYEDYEKVGVMRNKGGKYVPLFQNRITYPITDINNEIVAFSCRIDPYLPEEVKNSTGKYINSATSAIFSKKEALFGLGARWRELIKENGFCYIVEGAPDATILQQEGIAALGLLGLGSNDISAWKSLAIRYPNVKWHLCLDGDDAGYDRAFNLSVNSLFEFIDKNPQIVVNVSFLPQGIDPDEYILKYKKSGFINNIHNDKRTMSVEDFLSRKIISDVNRCKSLSEKRSLLFSDKGYKKALLSFPKSLRETYWQIIEEQTLVKIKESLDEIDQKRKVRSQSQKTERDDDISDNIYFGTDKSIRTKTTNGKTNTVAKFYQNNYPMLYLVKGSRELTDKLNQILKKYSFDEISLFDNISSNIGDAEAFWSANNRLIIDEYYFLFMRKHGDEDSADRFVSLYLDVFGKI